MPSSALRVDWPARPRWLEVDDVVAPERAHADSRRDVTRCSAAFPKGCLAMRARDALGLLFTDEQFTALFAARGRPAWSPARLALVLVLQFVEGLTDRQAADAVRG